ncbi:MAG: hypothetical protein SGPRY_010850, partial [Prymnesium sp.]
QFNTKCLYVKHEKKLGLHGSMMERMTTLKCLAKSVNEGDPTGEAGLNRLAPGLVPLLEGIYNVVDGNLQLPLCLGKSWVEWPDGLIKSSVGSSDGGRSAFVPLDASRRTSSVLAARPSMPCSPAMRFTCLSLTSVLLVLLLWLLVSLLMLVRLPCVVLAHVLRVVSRPVAQPMARQRAECSWWNCVGFNNFVPMSAMLPEVLTCMSVTVPSLIASLRCAMRVNTCFILFTV